MSSVSSLSLFPYLGGERQLGQVPCPHASSPASYPPLHTPCLSPRAQGSRPSQQRSSAFPGAWKGLGSWPTAAGTGISPSHPPLHAPGPGQHVDVSAELSCVLGHLLWCGIVPGVHWLQRGCPGPKPRPQQQSRTGRQEQQGEAAAGSRHLRSGEREGRGRTEPICPTPSPITHFSKPGNKGAEQRATWSSQTCPGERGQPGS